MVAMEVDGTASTGTGPGTRPLVIVVSAPSGAGKTTLCDRLLAEFPEIAYSVSCTTRPPRGREVDGEDYYFLSEAEFDRRLAAGEFVEHAAVHGHRYGTMRRTIAEALETGRSLLMDLDVQGAAQLRKAAAEAPPGDRLRAGYLDVFIEPPSMDALRGRLARRGEDDPETVARRLRNAEREMTHREEYRYRIVNDQVDEAYARFREVILAEMRGDG